MIWNLRVQNDHLAAPHDDHSFSAASLVFLLTESGILAVVSSLITTRTNLLFPTLESSHIHAVEKHHRLLSSSSALLQFSVLRLTSITFFL